MNDFRLLLYTFARDIDSYALILQFAYKATKNVMALHRPNSMCFEKMHVSLGPCNPSIMVWGASRDPTGLYSTIEPLREHFQGAVRAFGSQPDGEIRVERG